MYECLQRFRGESAPAAPEMPAFRFAWTMKNANFLCDSQIYEGRFGRKARQWTPEQLMALYFAAKERSDKRHKAASAVIGAALDELEPDEKGKIRIYSFSDGRVREHMLRKDPDFGWGWSQSWLEFSKDKEKARDEKIGFLLENARAFELGEELVAKDAMRSWLHQNVWTAICNLIDRRLGEIFKEARIRDIPRIFTIGFGEHAMYVQLDATWRANGWKKFDTLGLVEHERIEI